MRPLILGQDFCVHHCTGCDWTPHGTKRFMVNQKIVLEIDEPEADQFFGVKKSVNIPSRHYAVTHIQYRDLKEAVMLRPDEALKRANHSMWTDTYYMDPFKVGIDTLTQLTTDPQVNQDTGRISSYFYKFKVKAATPTNSGCGPMPPTERATVSSTTETRSDANRCVNLSR